MKRMIAAALVLLLATGPALAGFSPGWEALQSAWQADQGIALELGVDVTQWRALSELSLQSVKEALQSASLEAAIAREGWDVDLTMGGQSLLKAAHRSLDAEEAFLISPPDAAWTTEGDLHSLLLGDGAEALPLWLLEPELPQALLTLPEPLFPLLGAAEKRSKESTGLRHVGQGRERVDYSLSQEEWQTLWPELLGSLEAGLAGTLSDSPELKGQATELLQSLRFEGKGSLRSILDKEGLPIAWQWTGNLSWGGISARKVSLLYAYQAPKGLYLNLRAPAVKGKDDLTLQVSIAYPMEKAAQLLNGDLRLNWQTGADKGRLQLSARLKSQDLPEGEKLSGTLSLERSPSSEGNKALKLRLKPEVLFHEGTAEGSLQLSQETGSRRDLDLSLRLTLRPAGPLAPFPYGRAQAISGGDAAGLAQARERLNEGLMQAMVRWMRGMSPEARQALAHDMGRSSLRPTAIAPLPPPDETSNFVVSEPLIKEENP